MKKLAEEMVPTFGGNFGDFLSFLSSEEAPTLISPHRFSSALGEDLSSLLDMAHLQPGAVQSLEEIEYLQSHLRDSVRVIQASTDISGNVEKALSWFKNSQLSCFDCKTPQSLVSEGRVDDLIRYLQSLQAGWAG